MAWLIAPGIPVVGLIAALLLAFIIGLLLVARDWLRQQAVIWRTCREARRWVYRDACGCCFLVYPAGGERYPNTWVCPRCLAVTVTKRVRLRRSGTQVGA